MRTYVKANKVKTGQIIDPLEEGTWYRVIENKSVKLPGQRPHREIHVRPENIDGWKVFTFDSSNDVRIRKDS